MKPTIELTCGGMGSPWYGGGAFGSIIRFQVFQTVYGV